MLAQIKGTIGDVSLGEDGSAVAASRPFVGGVTPLVPCLDLEWPGGFAKWVWSLPYLVMAACLSWSKPLSVSWWHPPVTWIGRLVAVHGVRVLDVGAAALNG